MDSTNTKIKDSYKREMFETGAMKEPITGRGRFDLMPLDVVGDLLMMDMDKFHEYTSIDRILRGIDAFMCTKDTEFLYDVLLLFASYEYLDFEMSIKDAIICMTMDVAIHYEDALEKYEANNWMRGIPLHRLIDSAVRHLLQYIRGDKDEPHQRAFVWNIMGAIWTYVKRPELDDITRDEAVSGLY